MFQYLFRRLLIALLTLVCITLLVYGLIRQMPGDPTTMEINIMDPSSRPDEATIKRRRAQYYLDEPLAKAYVYWLRDRVFRGDFGFSDYQKQSVASAIGERVGPTLFLSVTSLVLAMGLSIPLGLYSSARSGRLDERIISTGLYMLYSFPSFVAALLLQYTFYLKLGWLPLDRLHTDGYEQWPFHEQLLDMVWHSILPVACYTYGSLAYDTRFIRANMAEVLRQDYIRTARAKGAGPVRVLWRHAFRNTLIPLVTVLGMMLPALLSGTVILERVFSWPGMGSLFIESIFARDYDLIMGLTLLFSVLTLLGTLLSDVLYAVVDPRVSYS